MKRIAAKLGAGVLTFAMVFALAGNVSAASLSQTQINAILDLLESFGASASTISDVNAALNGQPTSGGSNTGTACSFNFSRDLNVGSTGADVMDLQKFLNGQGFTIAASGAGAPGNETSYYGSLTAAAVSDFQEAYRADILTPVGLTSGTGYFGAGSRAKARMICSATGNTGNTGDDDDDDNGSDDSDLDGGAGSIGDADFLSALNNEEVGEDESDVEVAGLTIEANGSDIELRAVELNFDQVSAGNDLEDYADEVSVWFNGKEVARLDADEFEDDDNYNKTISLKSGAIIREDQTGELVVAVSGISNLDSADAGGTWNVSFPSVRFVDGQGAVITDSSTGDIGETNNDSTTDSDEREFSFNTFATAADVELKARLSDDSPDSTVVNVDASSDTDNVELLVFELEAEGSDIEVKDLPITFTVTGATDVDAVINTAYLSIDGEEFSETVSTSAAAAAITFDNVDYTISEGETVEVVVWVDVNDLDANFEEGDTIKAEFTASNRNSGDYEDETGENLATGDKTGTALGDEMAFYDTGISVKLIETDEEFVAQDSSNNDSATMKIVFEVSAFDGTVYLADTAAATTASTIASATGTAHLYRVTQGSTATTDDLSQIVTYSTAGGASDSSNGIKLDEGESAQITLTVSRTSDNAGDAGFFRTYLEAIGWNTDDTTTYNLYDFDLDDYKTDPVNIVN